MSSNDPVSSDPARRAWWLPVGLAIARAPHLWLTAVRQMIRLAPRGWWHRWPLLPLPDGDYLRFRLQTMYGGEGRSPDAADVLAYLSWCKRQKI
jgi:hypothetical protein